MGDLATFWGVLLAIAAGITALGGAWKYLRELRKPYDELKNRVIALERQNEKSKFTATDMMRFINQITMTLNQFAGFATHHHRY